MPCRDARAEQIEYEAECQGITECGQMEQNAYIHHRRIDVVAVRLSEEGFIETVCARYAEQQSQYSRAQGHNHILRQYLSGYAPARAAECSSDADLRYTLAQPTVRHAAQIHGGYDQQYQEDDSPCDIFCCHIRLIVGTEVQCLFFRVVRTIAVNQLHPFFLDGQVEFVHIRHRFIMHFLQVGFLSGKYHHAEYAPDAVHRRQIETFLFYCKRQPYLCIRFCSQRRYITYHSCHLH